MNHSDSIYLTEMIELVKNAKLDSKEKEEEFLIKHGAIDKDGTIMCDYPKLFYRKGDDKISMDFGGQLFAINMKVKELGDAGKNAWVDYVPRFYSFYQIANEIIWSNNT